MATSSHAFSTVPRSDASFGLGAADLTVEQLIHECATGDNETIWKEFTRRFESFIASVVSRAATRWMRVSPDLVDDLVQETYLKLCAEEYWHLRHFSSHNDCAIYSFLKTVACNATTDYFRSRWAVKRGGMFFQAEDLDTIQHKGQDARLETWVLVQEMEILIDQITDSEQEKMIFRLRYKEGYTTRAIAETDGVLLTQKGVESCLRRITSDLREICSRRPV
ncbi:MAG TPA: sigma-70 family RNA polymerase sigma factor [Nitrososphaera sp.]|nr:sigma-70 family RNA polymerase sigma factor [Nitrososphaera sp.]